jgi:hypothetical protein
MALSTQTRLLLAWLVLSAITLLAWWMGAHHGADVPRPDVAVAMGAITITIVKVRIIVLEFMEVRHAPARLRHIIDAWLVVFGVAMLVAYFA